MTADSRAPVLLGLPVQAETARHVGPQLRQAVRPHERRREKRERRSKQAAAAYAVLVMIAGCAAPFAPPEIDLTDVGAITKTTEWRRDEFAKSWTLQFPTRRIGGGNVLAEYADYFLRAWVPDYGLMTAQVYVIIYHYGDWYSYRSAYDLDGNLFRVTYINSDVSCSGGLALGCAYWETFGIDLGEKEIVDHGPRDWIFSARGSGPPLNLAIPSAVFQTLRKRVDELRDLGDFRK